MEPVRTLKANLKLDGKPCGWCQVALKLGDDAAVCTACEREHHGRCWTSKAGCSTTGCLNAPLRQIDAPVVGAAAAALPSHLMSCPMCRSTIAAGSQICISCKAITSPDGIYHGPKTNAPGAVQSLVLAIVGFFVCGVILGPLAISKANAAKALMKTDPRLGGEGLATAGTVIGILDLVAWAILMMLRASG